MPDLSWSVLAGARRKGVSERFVVCEDVEFTTLYKKTEVLDGFVDCQKLSIIRAISSFSRFELS